LGITLHRLVLSRACHEIRAIIAFVNEKLSCRRGTARRAVIVKTVLNIAQTFVELHLISPALGE